MGIVNFGPPEELIRRLKETYRITTFIETGTYHGCTAYWASSVFDHVITVEASESFYEKVAEKYRHIKNIEFIYGDSRERLGDVVARLDGPAIFWLDAHWSGGQTYGQTAQCPLIGEIGAINRSEHEHFILIDDARLFMSPPPSPHSIEQWPDICAVMSALNSSDNIKYITIFEDVITAVPSFAKHLVAHYCRDKNTGTQKERGGKPVETRPSDSCRAGAKSKQQRLTDSEAELIKKFISSGDVVFDIGANVGTWTEEVLNEHSNIQAHLFEPAPESYQKLVQNFAESIEAGQAVANNCAVSEKEGKRTFYFYQDHPRWSTFHRRLKVEKQLGLVPPESLMVPTITLDSYCSKMNVKRIHFLKVDTEGGELEVLRGARELLRKGKIDYLQFEYGGTFLDAGITLEDIFQYLRNMRYELFKLSSGGLEHIEQFSSAYEDYQYSNFLAVNERFKSKLLGKPPKMLNLQDLCSQYNIVPRGIIHIGAYEGKESKTYKEMGVQKVLFIEANPAVYERLEANVAALPNVQAVNCAISNYDGTTTLRVTSMDQSSSILPLKRHREIYPDIKEVRQITVKCRTIDSLLKELKLAPSDFNVINVDIQGAELMAFQGATEQLKYIEAINSEVNYEQLYEGCALIDELDEFLKDYAFERKATTTPYHRSWGDGFYVKAQANTPRSVITMSTLGKNGRFANQVFQYAFLKIYAKQHNLEVRTPPWIGQGLFGHNDPPIPRKLALVKETTNELAEAVVPNAKETFENVDFWGYFQYNTSYYAPHKDYFRSLFRPVPEIENKMSQLMNRLLSKGKTVIGLHLRRGDYGYGYFFVTPSEWYKRWLQDLWPALDDPVLFIASDEPEKVVGDFAEYNPVTSKDLGVDCPQAPFYPDFYILSKCDVVAISNSSFSFAACMLNEQGQHFWRPSLSAEGLIRFDPWNSETILRDQKVEDRQPGVKRTAESAKDRTEQLTYVRLGGRPQLEDMAQGWPHPSAKAVSVVEKGAKTISQAAESHAERDSFQYPSFNAIVSFLSSRGSYRPTIISSEEVFCGPDCETTMDADKYCTIKSPEGVYDIEQIAKRLPASQTPQLVAVKADATGRNFPINLQTLRCPKLLILGNTQHLKTPIRTLLEYALQEKFDFIMSDHKRHHLHYFKEIGFEKVFWLPAFNIFPHKQPYYEDKRYEVSFVGQAGRWHPYRKYILQYLKANGVPVNHFQVPPTKAAEIYAQSLVNLNVSLNGDLNLRVFEVLSSGGFLLTDKLTMESGLELLFKDGQHLVCFENDRDLLDKIQYFLKHYDEAKAIAQNGYEEFERNHTPGKKIKELSDYIFNDKLNPLYDIKEDKRSIYVKTDSPTELVRRVALYEFFQEIHLRITSALILFWPEVDGRLACDVLDLPRLQLFIKNDNDQVPDQNTRLFQNTHMTERIRLITAEQLRQMNYFWNVLVITASELLTVGLKNLLTSINFKWLVIPDGFDALDEQQKQKFRDILAAAGFEKRSEGLELYYWKDKNLWGEILYSENKIAEAINCFEQALLENPCHSNALNNLGVISWQLERFENAEKFLLKAVGLNRRNVNALINLAHLYLRMKRFDDAIELFQEAVSIDKDDASLWFHLGLCCEQSNRNAEALQAYKRCNELGAGKWPTAEKIQTIEKRTAAKRPKTTAKAILPPKRILVINNLYPPQELGGYGRLLCDFATILENRGHSIYVLTSDTPYLGPIDQDQSNVDRSLLLFGGWQNGVCRPIEDRQEIMRIIRKNDEKLQNTIKRFSPQLCLLGNIDFLSHIILQPLLKSRIPVIHHLGSPNPGYSVADAPREKLYIPAAASRWLKEQIVQQGYTFEDFRVIYPGALVKQFKMNILPDMDKLRIAYASIVLPYKGPHILINALKELHDQGIDFSCSLAGTSTDEKFVNSLKNFVTQTGMAEKVTFLGFLPREDLKNFFARHNVLAFPSLVSEAFGISQVEAMAAGLTVVTSGTGGAKEIVEHRLSGVIFNSGDHQSLARELLQLTEDKERWRQIALAGQKRALQCFDIEKSVDDIERIYCHLTQHSENGIKHGRKTRSSSKRYIVGKRNSTPDISAVPSQSSHSNPLVSIIMPAYNAAEYIAAAIESVLSQNYRNFELIIVDDGSIDNTKDIVAGFKDKKIKYFCKENAGAASARNLAIRKSKGDFLIPLDADDMITPEFIAKHLEQFEKHPETDLVYCDDCLIGEDDKQIQMVERPEYPDQKLLIRDLFHSGLPVVPFRTCIRKSVFDKIGFFDESLVVSEDYDMMRRFVKSGLKMHHLRDALYLRRMTPSNLSRNLTAQNAKCHFEVVKRFTDTFAYDELFPDLSWDEIPPEMRQLHAKCLAAVNCVAIGRAYVESNSPIYAKTAFELACSELNNCVRIDPNNSQLHQLLQQCESVRARYEQTLSQTVC